MSALYLRLASAAGLAIAACVCLGISESSAHASAPAGAQDGMKKPPKWMVKVKKNATTSVTVTISCPPPGKGLAQGGPADFSCVVIFLDASGGEISRIFGGAQTKTSSASSTTSAPTPDGTASVRVMCTGAVAPWGVASDYDTEFE